ncbi:BREX-1 system phosphatase PglZ type A, partial [Mycolicibacterium madagascariense]|nr:BREX-1 system phosphatase PglZ type A [Mycolicibacterium madagascariense]
MTELNSVKDAITNRLAAQRVVFWHDAAGEYDADVEALELGAVNVVRVHGNEFGVKSMILADHVTKHLVYRSGDIPRGTSNWLLDLELAYGVF